MDINNTSRLCLDSIDFIRIPIDTGLFVIDCAAQPEDRKVDGLTDGWMDGWWLELA